MVPEIVVATASSPVFPSASPTCGNEVAAATPSASLSAAAAGQILADVAKSAEPRAHTALCGAAQLRSARSLDGYFLGTLLNLLGSAAYVVLDWVPISPGPDLYATYVTLAAVFLADALLFASLWRAGGGCALRAWRAGAGTPLEASAEAANVGSSFIYLAATVLARYGDPNLFATFVLQLLATLLFVAEAVLYAAAWRAAAAADGAARAAAGAPPRAPRRGCCAPRDVYLHANALNVLAASAYAACAIAMTAVIAQAGGEAALIASGRAVSRGVGRMPAASLLAIGLVCAAMDIVYLLSAVLFCAAWSRDLSDAEEDGRVAQAKEEEEAAGGGAGGCAVATPAVLAADAPELA